MNGLTVTIEKGMMIIRIPMNATPTPSASGKTLVVCSTHGNQTTDCMVKVGKEDRPVTIGVNAYVRK